MSTQCLAYTHRIIRHVVFVVGLFAFGQSTSIAFEQLDIAVVRPSNFDTAIDPWSDYRRTLGYRVHRIDSDPDNQVIRNRLMALDKQLQDASRRWHRLYPFGG